MIKVNEISKLNLVSNVKSVKKMNPVNKEKNADKVEISREAKELSKTTQGLSADRIAEIKKRIDEKYYDRDEVLKVVAERILKSPKFQDTINHRRLDKNL
jgi:anti-sigma28 factor (negative regulator of flagellin synthesis)